MTDPLPPFVFAVFFEGAPKICRSSFEELRDWLADVLEDHAELYQVWAIDCRGDASDDRTEAFLNDWEACFEFGDGDDPDQFLAPFPSFILGFHRDQLIAAYRAAQEAA